jgi:opacity protein-like surface antigen
MKRLFLVLAFTAALGASQAASAQYASSQGPAAGDWEFRIGPVFMNSQDVDFKGGSTAKVKSNTGIKGGAGYYLNENLVLGGNFAYSKADFSGTVNGGTAGTTAFENGRLEFSSLMFDATYNFAQGPFRPFVEGGLGWNWINTNIATGPPQVGCWWDPWWGYVCNGYQPTKSNSSFAYQLGVGAQLNFNREFGLSASYKKTWIDMKNSSSTPGFDGFELLFNWRFPG